jgi:hypothetical protein
MHKTKTSVSGKDPTDAALIVFLAMLALFLVLMVTFPAIAGYFGQFSLPAKLHTPKLDSWNMLASGDLYVLSYPAVCNISGSLASAVTIACPSDSYIAVLVDLGYHVSCNSSVIYKGWNWAKGYYGYAYIYRAKTLSCGILYPPSGGGGGFIIIIPGVSSSND